MFDSFMVKEGSLENVVKDGFVIGFKFKVHIGEYRGCFLSLVHGYYIEVDGEEFPRSLQKFEINGKPPRTFDEIKKAVWEHWDYDDYATLYVQKPGGLSAGKHRLGIMQGLMTQYGWHGSTIRRNPRTWWANRQKSIISTWKCDEAGGKKIWRSKEECLSTAINRRSFSGRWIIMTCAGSCTII